MGKTIPYQRMGKTIDIAKACVYLASEDSDYMIGHVLVVDGGTIRMALPIIAKKKRNANERLFHANGIPTRS